MTAKVMFIGASLLLAAGTAFADDPGAAAGGGAGDPAAGGGTAGAPAPAPAPGDAGAATAGWSSAINDRPLVLPQGKLEVHGALPILAITTSNGMGMSTTDTAEALGVGATFGIADKLEGGLDYFFPLNPNGDVTKGFLDIHGAFSAIHTDKMDLAIAAGLAFNLSGSNTDFLLNLGGWFRYKVAPNISIFTGQPPIPFQLGGLSTFLAPPLPFQFEIGLNNSQPAILDLPVGIGLQATPQIFAFASLDLADIYLTNAPPNKSALVVGSDFIPVGIGAFFTADKLDVGVEFADDLKNAGDFYIVSLLARFYVK